METPPAVAGPSGPGYTPGLFQTGAQASALNTPTSPSPRHSIFQATVRGDSHTHLHASPAAPLAEPVLRLQDGEIILEEAGAASPAAAQGATTPLDSPLQRYTREQQQQQQQQQQQPTPLHSQAADYSSSRELVRPATQSQEQVLVASFSATAVAQASFMHQNTAPSGQADTAAVLGLPNGGDRRLQQGEAGLDDDAATSSEPMSRLRYRPTLTQENVMHMQKLEQYSTREDPTERMWRWLEGAGPPYEGSPSQGIPAKAAALGPGTLGGSGSSSKGGASRFWCFACFGGGTR